MFTRMREALGTVYGDIGTSVLYTIMEVTRDTVRLRNPDQSEESLLDAISAGTASISMEDALGGLSLIFWALVYLSIKYDVLIMRADNRGEGGTFALWGILKARASDRKSTRLNSSH